MEEIEGTCDDKADRISPGVIERSSFDPVFCAGSFEVDVVVDVDLGSSLVCEGTGITSDLCVGVLGVFGEGALIDCVGESRTDVFNTSELANGAVWETRSLTLGCLAREQKGMAAIDRLEPLSGLTVLWGRSAGA